MTTPGAPPAEAPAATLRGGKIETPVGDAPIIPLFLIGVGLYLAWFGVRYWRGTGDAVWPSYPIKSVLQGKGVPPNQPAQAADVTVTSYETASAVQQNTGTTGGGGSGGGSAPQGAAVGSGAQNMAKLLLSAYGWGAEQFAPLLSLWTRESGWSASAQNRSSGAYGIAQALGHGTSGTACPTTGVNEYGAQYGLTEAEAQAANCGSVQWQIEWGLGYIKSRYGSPAGALQHENTYGWY